MDDYMIPSMVEVGRLFEEHEYFIPEIMMSAKAMSIGFDVLEPLLAEKGAQKAGKIVLGTVRGDFHDIGKKIVAAMMRGNGIQVIDLGVDVPPEKFVEAVKASSVQLVGLSALLTTTMPQMKETIQLFSNEGLRDSVKVMVGGAAITAEYTREIGADYYGVNAAISARDALVILRDFSENLQTR